MIGTDRKSIMIGISRNIMIYPGRIPVLCNKFILKGNITYESFFEEKLFYSIDPVSYVYSGTCQTSAESNQQQIVIYPDSSGCNTIVPGNRYGGCGGISIVSDTFHAFIHRYI